MAYVRENYSKYEYKIAMRDRVKLFTAVYIPKDVAAEGKSYPILLVRTPYNVAPYGEDKFPNSLGPSALFTREKFIFAYQDVRGRYMSEGDFTIASPVLSGEPPGEPRHIDGLVTRKGDTEMYQAISSAFNNLVKNKTYDKILKQWNLEEGDYRKLSAH